MKYPSLYHIALCVCLVLIATFSFASETGTITGKVMLSDINEPAIVVSVKLTDMNIGTQTGTKTDVDGNYSILSVPAGIYSLRFIYVGYKVITIDSVVVTAGKTLTQNVSLKPLPNQGCTLFEAPVGLRYLVQ